MSPFPGSTEFIGDEVDFERGRLHDQQNSQHNHGMGSIPMNHKHFTRHEHQSEHAGGDGMTGEHQHETSRGNYHVADQEQHIGNNLTLESKRYHLAF